VVAFSIFFDFFQIFQRFWNTNDNQIEIPFSGLIIHNTSKSSAFEIRFHLIMQKSFWGFEDGGEGWVSESGRFDLWAAGAETL
jgi:hypothetical protein